jgi:hypothetical protein
VRPCATSYAVRRGRPAISRVSAVVEGAEPALVAAEQGVSRPVLVQQLRNAVEELAID